MITYIKQLYGRQRMIPALRKLLIALLILDSTFGIAQRKIMPFGDSITQADGKGHASYRRSLWMMLQDGKHNVDFVGSETHYSNGELLYQDFDFNHEGHSGLRADELRVRIRNWASAKKPDIVLMHAGTNDLLQGRSVGTTRNELAMIIDELRLAVPSVIVLMAQLIPMDGRKDRNGVIINNKVSELNALLPDLAKLKSTQVSPVLIVDQNSGFNVATDLYDGLHPNVSGEKKMSERWYQALLLFIGRPLPVELVHFSGRAEPAGTLLQWATASELNNVSFAIERSPTGTEFTPVGRIAGHGTTSNRHTYTFLDAAVPSQPVVYYRLRQTDTDSSAHYSGVIAVHPILVTTLEVSPVPTQDVVVVRGAPEHELITIWNMRGQLVYQQPVKSLPAPIQVSYLPNGVYLVQAGAQRVRFIKQ